MTLPPSVVGFKRRVVRDMVDQKKLVRVNDQTKLKDMRPGKVTFVSDTEHEDVYAAILLVCGPPPVQDWQKSETAICQWDSEACDFLFTLTESNQHIRKNWWKITQQCIDWYFEHEEQSHG